MSPSPAAVIQKQFDAYNARDIDAFMATYAADAEQFSLDGERLAAGHDQIRARMRARFNDPNLRAVLISRTTMENVVVDHERVTRNFEDGIASIEMLCVYRISGDRIDRATFAIGQTRLTAAT